MTAPNYTFRNTDTSRGLISSGEGSTEFYHPILVGSLFAASGFLLLLNGWNLNRRMVDVVGYDGTTTTASQLLQMRAPREAITPLISQPGTGSIIRPGARWRYRWYNSATGEFSGLSPLPDAPVNMGVETPLGSTNFLGQSAYFYIYVQNKPPHADTLQLFANTTDETDVWYLVDSKTSGANGTYVYFTDDNTDDALFFKLSVVTTSTTALPPGPGWSVGLMWPVVKAWSHPSGRVFYFGMRRFGVHGLSMTAAVTQGSDLVSMNAGVGTETRVIEPGRIGQRVRFYTVIGPPAVAVTDPTVYRIVKMESATTFRVWPELQVSALLADGASANWYWTVEDDRDARWTWISEPNQPWLIDPLKVIAAGDDFDDGCLHWFTVRHPSSFGFSVITRLFMQTKRCIYEVNNSETDPTAAQFVLLRPEGTTGFFSGCETPFGWVYYHEQLGVRVFDGRICSALGKAAQDPSQAGHAVVGGDPLQIFLPQTQILNVEPTYLDEVRCIYDPEHHMVIVSYVPLGMSTHRECLVFSAMDNTWRGPYRESVNVAGEIRSTTSGNVTVVGDEYGNLLTRESQNLDVTPTLPSFSGTGSITTVSTTRVFIDSAAHFAQDTDEAARGSPVWFTDGTYYYFARIADVLSDTQIELDAPPTREDGVAAVLTTGWTYGLGSIRWALTTAYIDAPGDQDGPGDPEKQSKFYRLALRFRRGTSSETFETGVAENANGTYVGTRISASSSPVPTRDSSGAIHGEMRFQREAGLIQIRLRGTARNSDPQITKALLIGEEMDNSIGT